MLRIKLERGGEVYLAQNEVFLNSYAVLTLLSIVSSQKQTIITNIIPNSIIYKKLVPAW